MSSQIKSNSLAIKAPHLRSEWSPKNTVRFEDVSYGSRTKYLWDCINGHEFEMSPNQRTDKGQRGCSKCPRNSLAIRAPELADEWHPDNDKKFHEVSYGSTVKYKWACKKYRHIWRASPNSRTHLKHNTGCPECAKMVTEENSLATIAPHLASEWHSSNEKKFEDVSYASNEICRWVCKLNHIWDATPDHRTKKGRESGCPDCAHRRVSELNSLKTKAPWLESEWHSSNTKRFEDVAYSSNDICSWVCKLGHIWSTTCGSRTRKNPSGCPECYKQHSKAELVIFEIVKEKYPDAVGRQRGLFKHKRMELDIYVPSLKKAVEYDGVYWHSRPKAQERDRRKDEQCVQIGIQLLRVSDVDYEADRDATIPRILAWLAEGNL